VSHPRRLFPVRNGRPAVDRTKPTNEWPLNAAYAVDVVGLRRRLPAHVEWWARLAMPDVVQCEAAVRAGDMLAP
jgi:hypothetical protein